MRRSVRKAALRRAAGFHITSASLVGCLMAGAPPLGCTSAGGVPRDAVQVRVTDAQGNTTGPLCTELPVLGGAQVEEELAVADVFTVRVLATARGVELTLTGEGLSSDQLYHISVDQLRDDEVQAIPIATFADAYTMTIQPGCSG